MEVLDHIKNGGLVGESRISLSNKKLGYFPDELFLLKESLEILDISGNDLNTLPDNLFEFKKLRILFASNNSFAELPSCLGKCTSLEMIGMRCCGISNVPGDSLPKNLRWLILTDNKLTSMPAELGSCDRLQKLMLSCNKLEKLPDMSRCNSLELIRLACNAIGESPLVLNNPKLVWAAIAGNKLTLDVELRMLTAKGPKPIAFENLVIHEMLGEGASGNIWRATEKESGQELAIKVFKAAFTSDGTPQSEMAAGLAAGSHRCLSTPLGRIDGYPGGKLAMALPLLPPGFVNLSGPPSFDSCTRDVYDPALSFTSEMSSRLLGCVRSAVEHLHCHGVVHGDLYAHNILWNPESGEAILSDFGASVISTTLAQETVKVLHEMEWRAYSILEAEIQGRIRS